MCILLATAGPPQVRVRGRPVGCVRVGRCLLACLLVSCCLKVECWSTFKMHTAKFLAGLLEINHQVIGALGVSTGVYAHVAPLHTPVHLSLSPPPMNLRPAGLCLCGGSGKGSPGQPPPVWGAPAAGCRRRAGGGGGTRVWWRGGGGRPGCGLVPGLGAWVAVAGG